MAEYRMAPVGKISTPSSSTQKPTTPASAITGTYGQNTVLPPPTVMPKYTSGSWANLPKGVLGSVPNQPAPATTPPPTGTPKSNNPLAGLLLGGLFGSLFGGSLPQNYQSLIDPRWRGLFGGGP